MPNPDSVSGPRRTRVPAAGAFPFRALVAGLLALAQPAGAQEGTVPSGTPLSGTAPVGTAPEGTPPAGTAPGDELLRPTLPRRGTGPAPSPDRPISRSERRWCESIGAPNPDCLSDRNRHLQRDTCLQAIGLPPSERPDSLTLRRMIHAKRTGGC